MKFKTKLIAGVLAGAMLALPIMTAPAFAEPANSNSNYVERVNWGHHDYDDGYRYRGYNRGYYGNRYYGYGYRGRGWGGYGACANAQRLQRQAWIDSRTGQPAAGWDLAQQTRWARAPRY